ncbi:hypothetical protein GM921_00785 [Pedobacter sp. LMG 31464]|uniref:HTH LytTR-type domain-containing protein n=1 Tax=Pedobacter planticolens TaxID=2679964 RepID=A0A923DUB9_9SPHI|nr:LytTR family DNA-binding domain-containing protein [Pedobacter planticolens]MBB2144006.1 hypothetical protein [Pedobacter planticolens]
MKTDTKGIKEVKIFYKDIVYIEAQHNHVIVYLENNKQHVVFNTMKDMEENLPFALFSRIHKSFIINDDKISYIEGNAVILNDNTKLKIVIGNTFRKAFIEKKNKRVIKGNKSKIKEEIMVGLLLPLTLMLTNLVNLVNELNFF